MIQSQRTLRFGGRLLRLCAVCTLAACTRSAIPDEALASLRDKDFSPKYHSSFWAEEATKGTALWAKAQAYCRRPESLQAANCRIVLAVDLTVRIVPVSPTDDISAREGAFIRRGAEHLQQLESVPRTGFRDPPAIPAPPRR